MCYGSPSWPGFIKGEALSLSLSRRRRPSLVSPLTPNASIRPIALAISGPRLVAYYDHVNVRVSLVTRLTRKEFLLRE